ncbi:hypothetical protein [Shinella sp.]|nr:hypothetical protein [Shinella sp.]MDX3977154.1 hypothetical protein [Shinella sp.]
MNDSSDGAVKILLSQSPLKLALDFCVIPELCIISGIVKTIAQGRPPV